LNCQPSQVDSILPTVLFDDVMPRKSSLDLAPQLVEEPLDFFGPAMDSELIPRISALLFSKVHHFISAKDFHAAFFAAIQRFHDFASLRAASRYLVSLVPGDFCDAACRNRGDIDSSQAVPGRYLASPSVRFQTQVAHGCKLGQGGLAWRLRTALRAFFLDGAQQG